MFQVQDVSYCGGSGRLGNVCDPKVRPLPASASVAAPPANPLLRGRTIVSFGISVANVSRSLEFYQGLFGTPIEQYQAGPPLVLSIARGPRPQFFTISPGNYQSGKYAAPPTLTAQSPITHFCVGIENFNAERVVKILADGGIKADLNMRDGTPEVFLWDPDNIRVQIQDVSYCGGSGPLGSVCDPNRRR